MLKALRTIVLIAIVLWAADWTGGACLAATPAVDSPANDKWAMVIGISNFKDQSLNLKYSAKDAKDFYDYLINEGNFKPDHVKLLLDKDASRENILSLLGDKWLPRVTLPGDLVVIYISSHGSPASLDVAGFNYLLAYNTDKDNLFATGIPINHLAQLIRERVHSNRVVLALDACHSGAADPDSKGILRISNFKAEDFMQGEGQVVICSSEPTQISWESKNYPNGVFTRKLIAGLRKKGETTPLIEAFDFTKEQVQQEVALDRGVLQTPVLKSKGDGPDLVLAAPPARPRPGLEEALIIRTAGGENARVQEPAAQELLNRPTGEEMTATPQSDKRSIFDKIAPVWHVEERSMGLHYNATWTYNKDKREFDGLWDNGTQSTLEILQYDGHRIIMSRKNYGGHYKGNRFRYEGTIEGNHASGTYTMVMRINYVKLFTGKWEASW